MVSGVCGRKRVRGRVTGGREAQVGGWKGFELSAAEAVPDEPLLRELVKDKEVRVEVEVAEVGAWMVALE